MNGNRNSTFLVALRKLVDLTQSIEEQEHISKTVNGMIILHPPSYTIEISYFTR
jgi:hypothetical protein